MKIDFFTFLKYFDKLSYKNKKITKSIIYPQQRQFYNWAKLHDMGQWGKKKNTEKLEKTKSFHKIQNSGFSPVIST